MRESKTKALRRPFSNKRKDGRKNNVTGNYRITCCGPQLISSIRWTMNINLHLGGNTSNLHHKVKTNLCQIALHSLGENSKKYLWREGMVADQHPQPRSEEAALLNIMWVENWLKQTDKVLPLLDFRGEPILYPQPNSLSGRKKMAN